MGVVFQDFSRYDLSAADNVGFGQVAEIDNQQRIVSAATKAGASEFVEKLPRGFDTILGKTVDEGVDLSGGEWQHLDFPCLHERCSYRDHGRTYGGARCI